MTKKYLKEVFDWSDNQILFAGT